MPDRFNDPVIAEIHAARAAMLDAAGGDVRLLMQQVGERQQRSTRRVIAQPLRKRTEPSDAPKPPTTEFRSKPSNPAAG